MTGPTVTFMFPYIEGYCRPALLSSECHPRVVESSSTTRRLHYFNRRVRLELVSLTHRTASDSVWDKVRQTYWTYLIHLIFEEYPTSL